MKPSARLDFGRVGAALGAAFLGLALLMALAGALATPYDPLALDFAARLAPPSWAHWLGNDQFGRDVLSRLLSAAATSLLLAVLAVLLALAIGVPLGAVSGYFGGVLDRAIMTVVDAIMALPGLLLALALMAALGPSKWGVSLALGLAYSPSVIRVVRGAALSVREKEYVEASRAMANAHGFTVLRHVIPNCVGPVTVLATALFANAILAESALSFLGLGVPPPSPSWGGMLSDARAYVGAAPWLAVFPGVAIAVTLLGVNLVGDAVRDRLDPRMATT